ncbi:hypothetical protein ACFQY4_26505 [Catellatospora bangladeshensis]|uniref:Uncharacterized protein n=1 Tax=Catellatospora bangladeshensis TaxID=310355 RepID=A0A8J3NMA4_9ACTN|nr:hypothetical protein [Catellatospora bangladeshensis]GIF85885.1 hypothetical protein Cba03nite_72340 [Catellatospora bangladeshensis]
MKLSASTRNLCAGVYLDSRFAQRVLLDAYADRSRHVAPSFGFDVAQVALHARRAWLIDSAQHVVLVGAILLIGAAPVVVVLAGGMIMIWHILHQLRLIAVDFGRYLRDRPGWGDLVGFRVRLSVVAMKSLVTTAVVLLALFVALGGSAVAAVWQPGKEATALVDVASSAVLVIVAATIAVLIGAAMRQAALHMLMEEDAAPARRLNRRMTYLQEAQRSRITFYSGYRPFVGSGEEIATWAFPLRLIKRQDDLSGTTQRLSEAEREEEFLPFGSEELMRRIRAELEGLRAEVDEILIPDYWPVDETKLPGLVVNDRLYVVESAADGISPIVDDAIAAARADPTGPARHYLACVVEGWGGETVTSVFVTASLQGRTLYLEFSVWALLPTRPDFHLSVGHGWRAVWSHTRLALRRLGNLPDEIQRVPGDLWSAVPYAFRTLVSLGRTGPRDDSRRSGTRFSVREDGAISRYVAAIAARQPKDMVSHHQRDVLLIVEADAATERAALRAVREADRLNRQAARAVNYFQMHDVKRHWKVLERRLLAAVLDFLDDMGFDTDEYVNRATTVLNHTGNLFVGPTNAQGAHFGSGDVHYSQQAPTGGSQQ